MFADYDPEQPLDFNDDRCYFEQYHQQEKVGNVVLPFGFHVVPIDDMEELIDID